ncbi:unnamed protein product [Owenia fusiformis]|uniref:Uncharacterized protein n=1 Tax=Owenia fusiformis TaxID=6347 RepID=A0A8J1U6S5_OWEFU|nr:unnamed protein product [Owenia fusiformis]
MRTFILLACFALLGHSIAEDAVENKVDAAVEEEDEKYNPKTDPCYSKECPIGKECVINKEGKGHCACMEECPEETSERAKVCSTSNITFDSECEMHRQKCLCHHKKDLCVDEKYKHVKLNYYGPCKEQDECTEEQMADFPLRMRDWLVLVMKNLADRGDLPEKTKKLTDENEKHTKKWVLPVIWKFCDLDLGFDRHLTYRDLLPLSAPLKTLEHCTGPFLGLCDSDDDGEITLKEWGHCLGLEDDEIADKCDEILN